MKTKNSDFAFEEDGDWELYNSTRDSSSVMNLPEQSSESPFPTETKTIVEKAMETMKQLLLKTSTGTATCEEKRHLMSLTSKLSKIRKEIEESLTSKSDNSLVSLREKAVTKTKELTKAIKTKDINNVF